MSQCRNCGTPLDGPYCANCGQKDIDLERPIIALISDVVEEVFDVDGRTFRTVRDLLIKPGELTRQFLAGRRQFYTPPVRLYLIVSVLFFVLIAWVAGQGLLLDPGQSPESDAAIQAQFMSSTLPRLMFVLLPVFALLLKLVFWRQYYFDHLVYSVHLHSAAYIMLAVVIPLEQLATENWAALIAQFVAFGYLMLYFVVSLRAVYGARGFTGAWKGIVVIIGYFIVVSITIEATSSFKWLSD